MVFVGNFLKYLSKAITHGTIHKFNTLMKPQIIINQSVGREKVQKELARMESIRVISHVDQLSPWCAGMVEVPKRMEQCTYV